MNQNKNVIEKPSNQPQLPTQLRAVLRIVSADDELRKKALPFVNIERREVDWQKIFSQDFGSGHRASLLWAKICWLDESPVKVDAFDRAFAMDNHLRVAVLEALAIRWGLSH